MKNKWLIAVVTALAGAAAYFVGGAFGRHSRGPTPVADVRMLVDAIQDTTDAARKLEVLIGQVEDSGGSAVTPAMLDTACLQFGVAELISVVPSYSHFSPRATALLFEFSARAERAEAARLALWNALSHRDNASGVACRAMALREALRGDFRGDAIGPSRLADLGEEAVAELERLGR